MHPLRAGGALSEEHCAAAPGCLHDHGVPRDHNSQVLGRMNGNMDTVLTIAGAQLMDSGKRG